MRKWWGVLAFIALVAVVAIFGNMGGNDPAETAASEEVEEVSFDQAEFDEDMTTVRRMLRTAHEEGARELTIEESSDAGDYTLKKYDVLELSDENYAKLVDHRNAFLEYREFTLAVSEEPTNYIELLNALDADYK